METQMHDQLRDLIWKARRMEEQMSAEPSAVKHAAPGKLRELQDKRMQAEEAVRMVDRCTGNELLEAIFRQIVSDFKQEIADCEHASSGTR